MLRNERPKRTVQTMAISPWLPILGSWRREYEMTQFEVVMLFNTKAKDLGDDHTTEDNAISRLAQFLADSEDRLSKEDFDFLTHMGALMYKHGLGQYSARADVAAVMSRSARFPAKE
jgi:hypothetical protein